MISEEWRQLNEEMHRLGKFDGPDSKWYVPQIRDMVDSLGAKSLLDYGCGSAVFTPEFPDLETHNYDPCVPKFNVEPPQCDVLVCFDVLEHVELEHLDKVLRHIHGLFRMGAYLAIATRKDSSKVMPDGTNPHQIIWSEEDWREALETYFIVRRVEPMMRGSCCFFIQKESK